MAPSYLGVFLGLGRVGARPDRNGATTLEDPAQADLGPGLVQYGRTSIWDLYLGPLFGTRQSGRTL